MPFFRQLNYPLFAVILFAAAMFAGCIFPPPKAEPKIIPAEELHLVSTVKKGKDLALAGRYDLAEEQFRIALAANPSQTSIYNDLGFALRGQDRLVEARQWLEKATAAEPSNATAHDNLARVLYDLKEFELAADEYRKLYELLSPGKNGATETPEQIVKEVAILRSLSAIYYELGFVDEALCYSRLTLSKSYDMPEAGRHVRLLFSVDQPRESLAVLDTFTAATGTLPPRLMLDYGIAVYETGGCENAALWFQHAADYSQGEFGERQQARLLTFLCTRDPNNSGQLEEFRERLAAVDGKVCENKASLIPSYWPYRTAATASLFLNEVCSNGNRGFLW